MYELDREYLSALEDLAGEIQESEELQQYLEEEEEEYYNQLKALFEPRIAQVYEEVADRDPLQLIPLELVLLDPLFEGLFLPKILGYSVLRGEIDEDYKYTRPQDHFKEVLLTICQSPNFEILKKRIGQSIQIGFALSSDIWITNLINGITNKRIRYFLQSQRLEKYRRLNERIAGYKRYRRQFQNENFYTAEFPENVSDLKILFPSLKNFVLQRIRMKRDNTTIIPALKDFIGNPEFQGTPEHLQIMGIYAFFFELEDDDQEHLKEQFNKVRREYPEYEGRLIDLILELRENEEIDLDPTADQRLSNILDKSIQDKVSAYFQLMDIVHQKGYITEEVQEAVRVFYNQYEGLSPINECVRQTIYQYFARFVQNLEETAYPDFFEISKLFPVYMGIFSNQQFNQYLKELSMAYVDRLMKRYTDKRGKDYQDIKKFVSATFHDLGFLKEKEVVELFKTRRKKKAVE